MQVNFKDWESGNARVLTQNDSLACGHNIISRVQVFSYQRI